MSGQIDLNADEPHPLADIDPWVRFDQHIQERNRLISGRRETEDGYIKTVIQLSSAILLLVPGLLNTLAKTGMAGIHNATLAGLSFIALSLTTALSEQFLSSIAYKTQIKKTDSYYLMKSSDMNPPTITKIVELVMLASFATFLVGILIISYSLVKNIKG